MKSRPTSVTVIAWILMVTSAISLASFAATWDNPAVRQALARSPFPISIQYAMIITGCLITIVSGGAMLSAHNWGRFLYVISTVIGFSINIVTSPMKALTILGLIFPLLIFYFLFTPKANRYFTHGKDAIQEPSDQQDSYAPQPWTIVVRRVIGILFYIAAGFFVYLVCFISSINVPAGGGNHLTFKFTSMGLFSVLGLVALVIGLAISGVQNWKRDTGIVLLSGSGMTVFLVLTVIFVFLNDEFKKQFPNRNLNAFFDFYSGSCCLVFFLLLGVMLIISSRKRAEQSNAFS